MLKFNRPSSPVRCAILIAGIVFAVPLVAVLYGVIGGLSAAMIVALGLDAALAWNHMSIMATGNAVVWGALLIVMFWARRRPAMSQPAE